MKHLRAECPFSTLKRTSLHDPLRTNAGSAQRTRPLSEIDLLRELQGVVNFDAEVADGALQLAVTQE